MTIPIPTEPKKTGRKVIICTLSTLAAFSLGVFITLGIQGWLSQEREHGCESVTTTKISPDKRMRAMLTSKVCAWGFGLAANFASVHIEKLGDNGWFMDVPLDADQPPGKFKGELEWKQNDFLQVTVQSSEFSGSLEQRSNEFHFVQSYVAIDTNS